LSYWGEKQQKLANLHIFKFCSHTFCIEDRALILNLNVVHAHAIHIKKNIHLSLLNLPWFSFENVHVFCLRQNKIKYKIFYSTAQLYFLFLGYDLKNPNLLFHRPLILKKNFNVGHK
jgi:hypothetical protein